MSFQVLGVSPMSTTKLVRDTRELIDEVPSSNKPETLNIDENTPFVYETNCFVLLVFHTDMDMRPCNPILRIVTLPVTKDTLQHQLRLNPRGLPMTLTCQIGDACINSAQELTIDPYRILSIYALKITDSEARSFINKISLANTNISKNQIALTHRSNIAMVPRIFHRAVQFGVRAVFQIHTAHELTDVQLCIMLLRECLDSARSVCVNLRRLHPFLATPENLQDAMTIYTRSLDKAAFNVGSFKFSFL